jgi:hypothetical protein
LNQDLSHNRPGEQLRTIAERAGFTNRLMVFCQRIVGLDSQVPSSRSALQGKKRVGSALGLLGPQWRALHSLPVSDRGAIIDHLLVGPAGVFSISTENYSGHHVWVTADEFVVQGASNYCVERSVNEARLASQTLSFVCGFEVSVQPVIVILARRVSVVAPSRDGVVTLGLKELLEWLEANLVTISEEQVKAIFDVARLSATWTSTHSQANRVKSNLEQTLTFPKPINGSVRMRMRMRGGARIRLK